MAKSKPFGKPVEMMPPQAKGAKKQVKETFANKAKGQKREFSRDYKDKK